MSERPFEVAQDPKKIKEESYDQQLETRTDWSEMLTISQGLGAAKDAVRMARIAKFYEQLPKGPAPEVKATGIMGRYQAKYFGKNPSAARTSLDCRFGHRLTIDSYLASHTRHHGRKLRHGVLLPPKYGTSTSRSPQY